MTYKDTLVLFGGEVANGTFVNDLWSFNMSTMQWKLLPGNAVSSPPGLASHTANVVGDKLFIFGGTFLSNIVIYQYHYVFDNLTDDM